MKSVKLRNELVLINLCSILLIVFIALVDVWALRVILGLPFLLFFPGYTLIAAVFPGKNALGTAERFALSVAFSVVLSPVVAFALNFLWRIDLYPVLIGVAAFTAVMSVLAWARRRMLAPEDRLEITVTWPFQAGGRFSALDRLVSVILLLAFLGAIVTLGYVVANPQEGERFTGFSIQGVQSRSMELVSGQPDVVTLGIANRELETMTYRIEVRAGETLVKTTDPVLLANGAEWRGEVSYVPTEVCALTQLTRPVNMAAENTTVTTDNKNLEVASVAHLAAGDKIWVGEEAATVERASGSTVTVVEALAQPHAVGAEVREVIRVEFRLIKIRQVGGQAGTSISLWVGKDHLKADLSNLGQAQAAYKVALVVGEVSGGPGTRAESALQNVAAGEKWTYEVDYSFSENHEIEVSLYKDGKLVYQGLESGAYPSLYLWVHVA